MFVDYCWLHFTLIARIVACDILNPIVNSSFVKKVNRRNQVHCNDLILVSIPAKLWIIEPRLSPLPELNTLGEFKLPLFPRISMTDVSPNNDFQLKHKTPPDINHMKLTLEVNGWDRFVPDIYSVTR